MNSTTNIHSMLHTAAAAPSPPARSSGGSAVVGSPLFALSPPHHQPRARPRRRRELTEAERAEISFAFDLLAAAAAEQGDGGGGGRHVTPRQLKVALRALGFPARKAEVRGMLRDAGLDATAPIDAASFHELVSSALLARPRAVELARAFALFDVRGSGKIGADDLRAVARRLGLGAGAASAAGVTPAELSAMVAEFDRDGNGAIDAAEFAAIMAEAAGDDDDDGGGDACCGHVAGGGGVGRSSGVWSSPPFRH